VHINIDVDDEPFNKSVAGVNNTVNLLTGAVVATEAAQVASINHNARKVGDTIVEGFFKTLRSEISQQIMELSQRISADLIHLRELAKQCVSKQKQMETDYNRISSRYLKIFDDLDNELENRIYALNKPAFVFKNNSDEQAVRSSGNDLVSTVAVFGGEGGELQARISASVVKKRAFDTINQANVYLLKQKKLENTITQSMLEESIASQRFAPVCFVETQNEKEQIEKNVYQSDFLPQMRATELIDGFKSQNWDSVSPNSKENIQRYFNSEASIVYSDGDAHANRVRETIAKLSDFNSIRSI
jgi:hypothetical protein